MSPGLIELGAALELFQAGLLAHDDIMDQDELRRGKPTLHKGFESEERRRANADGAVPTCSTRRSEREPNFKRLGESKGICAGDIFFFEAWNLVSRADPQLAAALSARFSRDLVDVCMAQIADVSFGMRKPFPNLEEALEVYTYKTARYTITLPLCTGASFAGRPDAVSALEVIGDPLGIVFQLQDDYLGLFGDERELGKPIGSDIREGKKTPFMIRLLPRLTAAEKASFFDIFGKDNIDAGDIDYIRRLVSANGVDDEIRGMIDASAQKTETALETFSRNVAGFNPEAFQLLHDFIEYSIARKS